jgi:glycosyltransferase involved in cell wall biosynthesis
MERTTGQPTGAGLLTVGLMTMEFLNPWGGIATYCLDLCEALADRVKFHVFTTRPAGGDLAPSGKQFGPNVAVHTICGMNGVVLTNMNYQLSLARRLSRLVKEYDLDLVHFGSSWAVKLFMAGGLKVPHVTTCHSTLLGQRRAIASSGSPFRDLHGSEKMTVLLYPALKSYESYTLSRTSRIIATSNTVRDELVQDYHYKGEVSVIQNGIDTDLFKPDAASSRRGDNALNRPKVLFSGRMIALKGPQVVIKAMPLVLQRHPDAVFIFAGAGDRAPYLEMLRAAGIPASSFEFCQLSYADMPRLYNSADLLVLPSLTEGFPKCILEGMACGLPAIASNVGDVADLVHDGSTGFLIDKGDFNALAERINLLLDDADLRRRLARNARELISSRFSVEAMAGQTLDVYRASLGREVS